MDTIEHVPPGKGWGSWLAGEGLALLVGSGFTLGIFTGLAHFENVRSGAPAPEIEDLKAAAVYSEPPPPKVEEQPKPEDIPVPLTGIDIGASESQVKISVVPPDLAMIIPSTEIPPRALIQFGQLFTDLKPKSDLSGDFQHIFQQNEVDQVPAAVYRAIPKISRRVRDDADTLRVTLLLVVDNEGVVTNIRVLKPSGNVEFDTIVTKCVQEEWVFSPAVRKGKKVKCMVQQPIAYTWTEGSPFKI
jgi:TonB family protein